MSKDVLYNTFINRVRDNLHIILCMSPVGEAFRSRCRQFPPHQLLHHRLVHGVARGGAQLSVDAVFVPDGARLGGGAKDVAAMCVDIHISVTETSARFYEELRRKFYTTPKSYLDLINLYTSLLAEKRDELGTARDRLLNGLLKLDETNEVVENMQVELGELQPVLKEKSAATEVLLVQVAKDKEEAAVVEEKVSAEEATAKAQAEETKAIADSAQADLDEAMPALEAAVDSLNALNKADIVEVKGFPNPLPGADDHGGGVHLAWREDGLGHGQEGAVARATSCPRCSSTTRITSRPRR